MREGWDDIYRGGGAFQNVEKRRAEPQLLQAQPYHNRPVPGSWLVPRDTAGFAERQASVSSQPHYVCTLGVWHSSLSSVIEYFTSCFHLSRNY